MTRWVDCPSVKRCFPAFVAGMAVLAAACPAQARPGISTNMSRPHLVSDVGADRISGRLNDWGYRAGIDRSTNDYAAALQFAKCVARFNPSVAGRVLSAPIGQVGDRSNLLRLAGQYRGCTITRSAVAPILLRAAFAETAIQREALGTKKKDNQKVGVPESVDGFPLGGIAACQLSFAPDKVRRLLATKPGTTDERAAAQLLYSGVPECGLVSGLGGLHPTVVRLALVEKAY